MNRWPPVDLPKKIVLPEPVRLREAVAALPLARHTPPPGLRQESRSLWLRHKGGERLVLSARQCRGLAGLADELPLAEHAGLARLVLSSSAVGLATLRALWEDVPQERKAIAQRLGVDVTKGGEFASQRMPRWLPMNERTGSGSLTRALAAPERPFIAALTGVPLSIEALVQRLEVLPTSPLGRELLEAGLRSRSDGEWQALGSPSELRTWAQTRDPRTVAIVAERQLLVFGRHAKAPWDLPENDESRALSAWVTNLLDPEQFLGRWADIAPRARTIFEWITVRSEIAKILREFAENAEEEDRSRFWTGQARLIQDARFVRAHDSEGQVAVCLIRVGDTLAIEFGRLNNALWVYDSTGAPYLRTVKRMFRDTKDFKEKSGLVLGGHVYGFDHYFSHQVGWPPRLQAKLHRWNNSKPPGMR